MSRGDATRVPGCQVGDDERSSPSVNLNIVLMPKYGPLEVAGDAALLPIAISGWIGAFTPADFGWPVGRCRSVAALLGFLEGTLCLRRERGTLLDSLRFLVFGVFHNQHMPRPAILKPVTFIGIAHRLI